MENAKNQFNTNKKLLKIDRKISILARLKLISYILIVPILVILIPFYIPLFGDLTYYDNAKEVMVSIIDYEQNYEINMNSKLVVHMGDETDTITFSELYWCGNGDIYSKSFHDSPSINILLIEEDNANLELFGKQYEDFTLNQRIADIKSAEVGILGYSIAILLLIAILFGIDKLINKRVNSLMLEKCTILNVEFKKTKSLFILKLIISIVISVLLITLFIIF